MESETLNAPRGSGLQNESIFTRLLQCRVGEVGLQTLHLMQISSLHHRLPCMGLMVQFHHLLILLKHLLTHTWHRITQPRTRFSELLLGLWSHFSCDKWLSGCIWTSTLYRPRFCCSGQCPSLPISNSSKGLLPQISHNLFPIQYNFRNSSNLLYIIFSHFIYSPQMEENAITSGRLVLFSLFGIIHETSCPCTPKQNGIPERKHTHLIEQSSDVEPEERLTQYQFNIFEGSNLRNPIHLSYIGKTNGLNLKCNITT